VADLCCSSVQLVVCIVNVDNVVSAHTNDIAALRRRHTRSIRDVAANICRMSMFGMECVADDVET